MVSIPLAYKVADFVFAVFDSYKHGEKRKTFLVLSDYNVVIEAL